MADREELNSEQFRFSGLHPDVFMGIASDSYAGWLGQLYAAQRKAARITRRKKTVGETPYQHPAVARWHAHLSDLATAIHELSGLRDHTLVQIDKVQRRFKVAVHPWKISPLPWNCSGSFGDASFL